MEALRWALGAGAVGTVAAALWGFWWKRYAKGLEKDVLLLRAQANDLGRQFRELQGESADDVRRLEFVVTQLKREIALLEADLDACESPDVVRSRLRRLLATPSGGLGLEASAVVVPAGGAASAG